MKDSLPFRIPSVSLLIHLVMHSVHLFRLALAINPANCHTWTRCDYERLIPEKSYSANVWPVPSRLVRRLNIKYWREPHPSSSWIISLLLLLYSMGKDDVYWPNKTVSLSPKATQVCHLAQWLCLPRTARRPFLYWNIHAVWKGDGSWEGERGEWNVPLVARGKSRECPHLVTLSVWLARPSTCGAAAVAAVTEKGRLMDF